MRLHSLIRLIFRGWNHRPLDIYLISTTSSGTLILSTKILWPTDIVGFGLMKQTKFHQPIVQLTDYGKSYYKVENYRSVMHPSLQGLLILANLSSLKVSTSLPFPLPIPMIETGSQKTLEWRLMNTRS